MAECIGDIIWANGYGHVIQGPCRGSAFIVLAVREISDAPFGQNGPYLTFPRWPDKRFDARAFRKLTPRADAADAADAAFINGLRHRRIAAPSPSLPIAARLKRMFS